MEVTARPGVAHEALEHALFAEVDRLTADGPSQDELERVRNLHAASVESSLERVGERADRLSQYTCLFDQPERINSEVSRYVAVDAARLREGMAAVLRPDNRVVLTYLPFESAGAVE
jgi:zinc protease